MGTAQFVQHIKDWYGMHWALTVWCFGSSRNEAFPLYYYLWIGSGCLILARMREEKDGGWICAGWSKFAQRAWGRKGRDIVCVLLVHPRPILAGERNRVLSSRGAFAFWDS